MKEFIEKLISRLEETDLNDIQMVVREVLLKYGFPYESVVQDEVWDALDGLSTNKFAIGIINQLAEEYDNESVKEDLISRRVAKTKMAEWLRNWLGEKDKRSLEQALDELPTACNDGWIPCSERLPEDNRTYEVTEDYAGVIFTNFASYDSVNKIWWTNDEDGFSDVLAWRERSAPYQPKGE